MKKQLTYITLLLSLALLAASCNKWLDVKPKDRTIEDQIYNTEDGFYTALNGVYLDLCSESLYGAQLSMEMLELLAQRYNTSVTNHYAQVVSSYSYGDSKMKSKVDNAWKGLYRNISNLNRMLYMIETKKSVFGSEMSYKLLKGQALGLRAFLHFDLLRLFGPIYKSADSTAKSIPYYDHYTIEYQPFLPANDYMNKVMQDINDAETLLAASDPVISSGPLFSAAPGNGSNKFRFRNMAMNYYAVELLKARALLYREDKAGALAVTTAVLPDIEKWFPFVNVNNVTDNVNPDKVFSTELIFGQFDSRLYEMYNKYFSPVVPEAGLLTSQATRLSSLYESNENDYRYKSIFWRVPDNNAVTYKCYYKYSDIINKDKNYRFLLPLMRKTEFYYIAAECETNTTKALDYLNTVRKARGLVDLAANAAVVTEIRKEYMKEFFGEGQLFFYYKRTNNTSIPNGSAASGNVSMTPAKYVLPIPDSELAYRN